MATKLNPFTGSFDFVDSSLDFGTLFKGAWAIGTSYVIDEVVEYGSQLYVALRSTVGDQPDVSASDWNGPLLRGATGSSGVLNATTLSALTTTELSVLTTTQLGALSHNSFGGLTTGNPHTQYALVDAALSTTQLAGLTTTQLGSLTTTQLGGLVPNLPLGTLTTTQFAVLTTTQLGGLTNVPAGSLTFTPSGTLAETLTAQVAMTHMWSTGMLSGGDLTDHGDGTVSIAACDFMQRQGTSLDSPLVPTRVAASSPLTLSANNVSYLYLDWNGGTPTWTVGTVTSDFNGIDKVMSYIVARNATHNCIMDLRDCNVDVNRKMRRQSLESDGFYWQGFSRSKEGISALSSSGLNLLVTNGKYFFYNNVLLQSAFDTTVAGTDYANVFTVWYNRTGTWTQVADQKNINVTQYDSAGTLTTMTASRWRADYVYINIDGDHAHLHVVLGNAQYTSQANAENAPLPASCPPQYEGTCILVGLVVVQKNASTVTTYSAGQQAFSGAATADHGALSGLEDNDHPQYTLTSAGLTTTALAYITTTQIQTISTTLISALTTTQLGGLTTTHVSAMGAALPNALLSTTQIAGLTTTSMASLTTTALGGLSTTQIQTIAVVPIGGFAQTVTSQIFKHMAETVNAMGDLGGGTDAIDLTLGNVVTALVSTSAQTFTFTNPATTGLYEGFTLILQNGGSQTITWPASVDWVGGVAPTLTTAGYDVLVFHTVNAGTLWMGFVVGKDVK